MTQDDVRAGQLDVLVPELVAVEVAPGTRMLVVSDLELASRLAHGPTVALGSMRHSVAYAAGHTFEESLAVEAEMMNRSGATADHRAAVEAFVAKQKPVFEGR